MTSEVQIDELEENVKTKQLKEWLSQYVPPIKNNGRIEPKLILEDIANIEADSFPPGRPTLTINESESGSFLKEGRCPVPNFRIAYDEKGNKFLLKTSIFLVGENEKLLKENDFTNPEEYREIVWGLMAEEIAWKLGQIIGVPMAETFFVEIEDTPFIAYKFIDGVNDIGFGGGDINFDTNNQEQLKKQELALAKGALLKFLLGGSGDNGQYLQDPSGNIYCSDIHFSPQQPLTEKRLLAEIAQLGLSGYGYFIPRLKNLEHQINGMNLPEFRKILENLESLDLGLVIKIISTHPENPSEEDKVNAESFIDRARRAKTIFTLLLENPNDTIRMLSPKLDDGIDAFTPDQVNQARIALFQKLNNLTKLRMESP